MATARFPISCFLLAVVFAFVSSHAAVSQGEPTATSDLFFDTVEVNVVNVEVIVTDKNGVPLSGLGPADFALFEDGRPVVLSNFFAVEGRRTVRAGIDGLEPPDAASGPDTQQLNLIVFIDDFNLLPQNRNLIFKNLRTYLAKGLDPRDQVLLARFDGNVEIAQPFTNDPELLRAALDRMEDLQGQYAVFAAQRAQILNGIDHAALFGRGNPDGQLRAGLVNPGDFSQTEQTARSLANEIRDFSERSHRRTLGTLGALGTFTDSLAGMRGRKAILYVSDGLSLRPGDGLAQAWLDKFEGWALDNGLQDLVRLVPALSNSDFDASEGFKELVARSSASRVAFYPLSSSGRQTAHVSAAVSGAAVGTLGARSVDPAGLEAFSTESSLLTLAEGTGGLAYTRSANIGGLLERMTRDFETFYSLGYNPPAQREAGFHAVEVRVRRAGAEVRHLKGYRQRDPFENLQNLALSTASTGFEDNTLEVQLTPGQQTKNDGDRYRVELLVQIPFDKLLLLPEEESHTGKVTLYVVVRDLERSGVSKPQRIELPLRIPNDRILETRGQLATYPLQLEMAKGRKRVSLGVRDDLARIDATVSLELAVGNQG